MALRTSHIERKPSFFALIIFALVVMAVTLVSLFSVNQAQGGGEEDDSTLGLGVAQAHSDGTAVSALDRVSSSAAAGSSSLQVTEAVDPSEGAQRSITVKDPDPVVVPVAVDHSNPEAVKKAKEVCTLDPLPTAPRVAPDTNDGTWSSGVASAYTIATNDDGKGNFGVTATASGIDLSESSVTVAVPESQAHLLGRIVEVCYDGKVVIATVTDTGGFARYGRVLDLAPGVYKAFGFSSYEDWGTRTVSYRFL